MGRPSPHPVANGSTSSLFVFDPSFELPASGRSKGETFTGLFLIPEDPALDAAMCEALGA